MIFLFFYTFIHLFQSSKIEIHKYVFFVAVVFFGKEYISEICNHTFFSFLKLYRFFWRTRPKDLFGRLGYQRKTNIYGNKGYSSFKVLRFHPWDRNFSIPGWKFFQPQDRKHTLNYHTKRRQATLSTHCLNWTTQKILHPRSFCLHFN